MIDLKDRDAMVKYILYGLKIGGIFVEVGCDVCAFSKNIIRSKLMDRCYVVDTWDKNLFYRETTDEEMADRYNQVLSMSMEYDSVYPIKGKSIEVSRAFRDESLAWVYIDALHDYWSVKRDVDAWLPKVRRGGIISGHDYHMAGVKKVVDETFENVETAGNEHDMSWFVRL